VIAIRPLASGSVLAFGTACSSEAAAAPAAAQVQAGDRQRMVGNSCTDFAAVPETRVASPSPCDDDLSAVLRNSALAHGRPLLHT